MKGRGPGKEETPANSKRKQEQETSRAIDSVQIGKRGNGSRGTGTYPGRTIEGLSPRNRLIGLAGRFAIRNADTEEMCPSFENCRA